MSRKGNQFDNAMAENFFSILKQNVLMETNYVPMMSRAPHR